MTARSLGPSALLAVFIGALLAAAVHSRAASQSQTQPQTRPDGSAQQENLVYVLMTTSKGDIVIELNREKAPITVENFVTYVDKGHFSGTIFHRIMKDFMIQGGGFTADMQQKPTGKPIKLESNNGLSNKRGTLAMARTGVPDSATCQFFINVVDNGAMLDAKGPNTGYAVFGQVVAGMNVVDTIRNVPVGPNPSTREMSQPKEIVTIEKASRLTADQAKERINKEKGAAVR